MAKSMRSKREKRLRAIRREIVEPYYENKDTAKLAAQAAALAAPKLPVRPSQNSTAAMDLTTAAAAATATATATATTTINTTDISSTASIFSVNEMDVEMADRIQSMGSLKPVGGIGKKSKRKFKVGGKAKRRGKGIRRKRHI